jgi:hypothetical protein
LTLRLCVLVQMKPWRRTMIGLTSDVLCVLLYYTRHSDIHTDTRTPTPSSYPICPTISTPIQTTLRSICHTHMHAHIENIAYTNTHMTHPYPTYSGLLIILSHVPLPPWWAAWRNYFPPSFSLSVSVPSTPSVSPEGPSLWDLIIESIKRVQWPWQIDLIYNIIISSSNMGERKSLTGEDGRGNLSYFIYS